MPDFDIELDDDLPEMMKLILAEMGDEALTDAVIDPTKIYTCRLMAYKVKEKIALGIPVKFLILTIAIEELGNKTIDLFFDKSQVATYNQYMQIFSAIKATRDLAVQTGTPKAQAPDNLFLASIKVNSEGFPRLTMIKELDPKKENSDE